MIRRVCLFVCLFVTFVLISRSKSASQIFMKFGTEVQPHLCQMSLLIRSRSKSKVICFVHDLSTTAMTKRKQVYARSMSSYLGRVIRLYKHRRRSSVNFRGGGKTFLPEKYV